MTDTLLCCPFCGGAATVQPWVDPPEVGGAIARIRCTRCSAQSAPYADASYAAEAWNRRAPGLRWRSEPPDAPGIWLQRLGITLQAMRLTARGVAYYGPPEMRRLSEVRGWFWAGPIPEPEEPAE